MINAIKKIGEYVAGKNIDRDTFLKNICLEIEPEREIKQNDGKRKKVKQYIVFINLNTEKKKIEITSEAVNASDKNTGREYYWIGDTIRHKLYCPVTTTKFENLLGKTISELYEKRGINNELNKQINYHFFRDEKIKFESLDFNNEIFEEKQSQINELIKELEQIKTKNDKKEIVKKINKFKKKISLDKSKIKDNVNIEDIISGLIQINENLKDILIKRHENIDSIIEDIFTYKLNNFHYEKKLRTKSSQVSLYSLLINEKPIANESEYKDFIYNEKIEKLYSEKSNYKKNYKKKSICSICGQTNIPTTSKVTNLTFKFYMNDKLGFSSNLDGKFKNNYNICKDCYKSLMIAERYINEKLKSRIGGLYAYILPKFFHDIDDFNIDEFSRFIIFKNQQISDIRKAEDFLENELEMFDKHSNEYLIDYLFFQTSGSSSEFKIYKLIKDIPPSRINIIKKREQDIRNLIDEIFASNKNFYIDLNRIWNCIPVKIQKESKHGYSKYLDVLDSIFSNRKIKYDFLINQAIATLRIIKFETPKFNIWNQEDIVNKIMQLNFLILFIKKLNILGGCTMNEQSQEHFTTEMIPYNILEYWENLEMYEDNQKKGLFLLGYLIGEIGNQQRVKEIKNKPILNKLNFQGMGKEKLNRLSSDVLEKLKQYKLLEFNENVYSASHLMIEENIENWSLTNQENVFYILSGFAFSNYLLRKRSKDKYSEELQEKIQLLEKFKSDGNNIDHYENILQEAKKIGTDEHKYSEARKLLKTIKKQEDK